MKTQIAHTRTAKLIGTSLLVGSLFMALTGCTAAESAPQVAVDNGAPVATATATEVVAVDRGEFYSTFVRAISGDTIVVTPTSGPDLSEQTVRLLGIDAPEATACGGPESIAYLESFVNEGDTLIISYDPKVDTVDKDDNTLAYARTNVMVSYDLGYKMTATGHAAPSSTEGQATPMNAKTYTEQTQTAQAQDLGVWATCDTIAG